MQSLLENIQLTSVEDVIRWRWSSNGLFSVHNAYNFFINGGITSSFPMSIWFLSVPEKIKLFIWLAYHNRLLTADNLRKRNFPTPQSCPLCGSDEETTEHLLLACHFSSQIWGVITQRLSLPSPPHNFRHLLEAWQHNNDKNIPKKMIRLVILAVSWSLWKERNKRIFHFEANSHRKIMEAAMAILKGWSSAAESQHKLLLEKLIHFLEPAH